MKTDIYAELHLWNKNLDSLIRVLQRTEALGICSRERLKAHEARIEELRASLNGDFTEAMAIRERADETLLRQQNATAYCKRSPEEDHVH